MVVLYSEASEAWEEAVWGWLVLLPCSAYAVSAAVRSVCAVFLIRSCSRNLYRQELKWKAL